MIEDIHNTKGKQIFSSVFLSVVKPASPMCSNSAWERHNKLLLYLLNNKGPSYLISANTVSVLRTQCAITSRTLHVELLKPFRRQYVTYQVTYRIIITLEGSNSTFTSARFCLSLKKRKKYFFFFSKTCTKTLF